jgi:hypothetical protein
MREGIMQEPTRLVRLEADGAVIYVEARDLDREIDPDGEFDAGGGRRRDQVRAKLDDVLDGVATAATRLGTRLAGTGATRYTIEFGCDVSVETGHAVALIGRGSATSTMKVTVEWSRPVP